MPNVLQALKGLAWDRITRRLLLFIVGGLILLQFSSISGHLAHHADYRSVVSSFDDDGGYIISKAVKTKWWNDNGNFGYGPFYFRLAHTFARLDLFPLAIKGETKQEVLEKNHHFVLMLISLLALYGICFLISLNITSDLLGRMLSVLVMMAAFSTNLMWVDYIFRPHPDMLFGFMVTLSVLATLEYLKDPERKKLFRTSAVLWGITASTKLTICLFVPAFIFLFLPPFNKQQIIKMFRYAGWMLLAYFLIGFPQNFIMWKSIKFLLYQSGFSYMGNLSTVMHWGAVFFKHAWIPVLMLLALKFALNDNRQVFNNPKPLLKISAFLAIPLIAMVARYYTSPYLHYTFPFIGGFCLIAAVALKEYYPLVLPVRLRSVAMPIALICLVRFTFGFVPETYNKQLNTILHCRDTYRDVHFKVRKYMQDGRHIMVMPYAPFDRAYEDKYVTFSWNHTYADMQPGVQSVLVFNYPTYRDRYTKHEKVTDYVAVDTPNFDATKEFYATFDGKERTTDKYGQTWNRVYQKCNIELWEREGV